MNALSSLKSLPCPAGDKCTAFQCVFSHPTKTSCSAATASVSHPSPSSAGNPASASSSSAALSSEPTSPSRNQEIPRKRVKISPGAESRLTSRPAQPSTPSSVTAGGPSQSRPTPDAPPASASPSNSRVQTPTKPGLGSAAGSKTPLKRTGPAAQLTSSPAAKQAHGSAKAPAAAKASEGTAEPPARKAESLNPRMLKKAPAKHDIRMKLVKLLHDQYTRLNRELKKDLGKASGEDGKPLLLSDQELIWKVLDDEQDIAINKTSVYSNAIKNLITSYKRMTVTKWKEERLKLVKEKNAQQESNGKPDGAPKEPKIVETGLTSRQEVKFLKYLVCDLGELEQFGYVPRIPSEADIEAARDAVQTSGGTESCDRCTRRFTVYPGRREEDGALVSKGSCIHHPGRIYYMDRSIGDRSRPQRKYRCCQWNVEDNGDGAASSAGCTTASTHVFKTTDPKRLASVLNFAETPPNPDIPDDRAVCFDCEMGYTTQGMELIRLTATAWPGGEALLDVLVKPVGEILDLNTRYSGISSDDMLSAKQWKAGDPFPSPSAAKSAPSAGGTAVQHQNLQLVPSPKEARGLLFKLLGPQTPLIAHGAENDLNAARVVHPTVIDTILLYPHNRGLPMRNGLKALMEKHLDRKIQVDHAAVPPADGEVDGAPPTQQGHDSAEDARAAGELVRLAVRDRWRKMQMQGWTLSADGEDFVPPEGGEWQVAGRGGARG